jgi:hypothetical protein
MVYAVAVRLLIRRLSLLRWTAATLGLWGIHVLIGALADVAVADIAPSRAGVAATDPFPPPAILGLVWVPLLLVPLRDVIRGQSPRPAARRSPGRGAESGHGNGAGPLAAGPRVASGTSRPGIASASRTPAVPASEDRQGTERPVIRQTGPVPRPSRAPREPAERSAALRSTTDGEALTRAAASLSPNPLDEAVHEASPIVMRVSFDRVAGQLPAEAFQVPLARIGPSLTEPGHLLIPRPLVLAQLAEGFVRAEWKVVAEQFPRHMLSLTDVEVAARLADGHLVLPLDELVSQLPRDLLAPSGPPIQAESIESVPAPFQPVSAAPDEAGGRREPAPDLSSMGAAVESLRSTHAWSSPAREEPSAEVAVLEESEPLPVVVGALDMEPGSQLAGDLAPWDRTDTAPAPDDAPPRRRAKGREIGAVVDTVAAALAPLSPLGVAVEAVDDATLLTASGPGSRAISEAVPAFLPLLADGRAPWPVSQLTMWDAESVLILTPLCAMRRGGAVLVSTVAPGRAVAAVERLSLRAAAAGLSIAISPRTDPEVAEAYEETDLIEMEPSTQNREIAASLDALGPVALSVLREATALRDFYLFLPPGSDIRMTCRFVAQLDKAAGQRDGAGRAFHTAVLRCGGRRRLIVRLDRPAPGRRAIVVAGGETERAGLALRQVEAAAQRLGAR